MNSGSIAGSMPPPPPPPKKDKGDSHSSHDWGGARPKTSSTHPKGEDKRRHSSVTGVTPQALRPLIRSQSMLELLPGEAIERGSLEDLLRQQRRFVVHSQTHASLGSKQLTSFRHYRAMSVPLNWEPFTTAQWLAQQKLKYAQSLDLKKSFEPEKCFSIKTGRSGSHRRDVTRGFSKGIKCQKLSTIAEDQCTQHTPLPRNARSLTSMAQGSKLELELAAMQRQMMQLEEDALALEEREQKNKIQRQAVLNLASTVSMEMSERAQVSNEHTDSQLTTSLMSSDISQQEKAVTTKEDAAPLMEEDVPKADTISGTHCTDGSLTQVSMKQVTYRGRNRPRTRSSKGTRSKIIAAVVVVLSILSLGIFLAIFLRSRQSQITSSPTPSFPPPTMLSPATPTPVIRNDTSTNGTVAPTSPSQTQTTTPLNETSSTTSQSTMGTIAANTTSVVRTTTETTALETPTRPTFNTSTTKQPSIIPRRERFYQCWRGGRGIGNIQHIDLLQQARNIDPKQFAKQLLLELDNINHAVQVFINSLPQNLPSSYRDSLRFLAEICTGDTRQLLLEILKRHGWIR